MLNMISPTFHNLNPPFFRFFSKQLSSDFEIYLKECIFELFLLFILIMFQLSWLILNAFEYFNWFSFHGSPLPQQVRKVTIFDFMKSYSRDMRCLMSLFAM